MGLRIKLFVLEKDSRIYMGEEVRMGPWVGRAVVVLCNRILIMKLNNGRNE